MSLINLSWLYREQRLSLVKGIAQQRISKFAKKEALPSLTRSGCAYLMQKCTDGCLARLVSDGRDFESVKTMSHVGLGQFIDADNIAIIYGALSSDSMENQYQLFQKQVESTKQSRGNANAAVHTPSYVNSMPRSLSHALVLEANDSTIAGSTKHGVSIVENIRKGINPSSLHQIHFTGKFAGKGFRIGAIAGMVALTEAVAIGRTFASMKDYHLDGNKEMLALGVSISFAKILLQVTRPRTAVLGNLPGTAIYRNIVQYPDAKTVPGMLIVRVDSAIYFSNSNYVRERILRWLTDEEEKPKVNDLLRIQLLIVELSPVTDIDTSGIHALEELHRSLQKREIQLLLANPGQAVINKLHESKLTELIGQDKIFLTVGDAVLTCSPKMAVSDV
ncbi:hypothetical protein ACLOJK_003962 [Asimina triloba]